MALSVDKLETLLNKLDCSVTRYYSYKDSIIYVECVYQITKDNFLVFINDDYKIRSDDKTKNILSLKRIDDKDINEIMEKYTMEQDKLEISKIYSNNINLNNTETKPEVVENTLEEGYNISLDLKSKNDDNFSIKEIKRQIRRLKMSIEGSKYRLAMSYQEFLVIARKENEVIFKIKEGNTEKIRKVYAIIEIETLLTDNKLLKNLHKVYIGFIDILNKNIIINKQKIEEFKQIDISLQTVMEVVDKINRYSNYIAELTIINETKINEENEIKEQIKSIKSKPNYGLKDDLKITSQCSEFEDRINKIQEEKKYITNQILDIKLKQQNNSLILDRILFDNIILLSTLKYNLSNLNLIK